MKIYDLKKLEKCFICGNIDRSMERFVEKITSNLSNYTKKEHPKEAERQERLRMRNNEPSPRNVMESLRREMNKKMKKASSYSDGTYNNSAIIVCGNCGIGNKSDKYYQETFEKLEKILADNNCFVFFVRGNNDNPSFFNECKIDFEHVKTVPDYSVILLKSYNCLCIGGSVSLDKEWKLSQEKEFGKKLFWEGEEPLFDEKELDEIIAKYQIGCIVSSTCPSFAFPGTNAFNKSKWIKENKDIKTSLSNERKILDKVYDKIIDSDKKPYVWAYGRFKQNNQGRINDIVFDSISPYQFEDVNNIISSYFGIDASKKLGENVFALDSFFCDMEKKQYSASIRPYHIDEPMEEDVEEHEEEGDGVFADDTDELDDILGHLGGEELDAVDREAEAPRLTMEDIPQVTITNPYENNLYRGEQARTALEEAATRLVYHNHGTADTATVRAEEPRFWQPAAYNLDWTANLGEITHNG